MTRLWRSTTYGKVIIIAVIGVLIAVAAHAVFRPLLTSRLSASERPAPDNGVKTPIRSKRMANVGINVEAIEYWSQDFPFIDRVKTMNPWTAVPNDSSIARYTPPTDANGYPIAQPGTSVYYQALIPIEPASAGTSRIYHLYYNGDATIILNGATVISQKPGETVVDVTNASGLLTMVPKDGGTLPTEFHMVRDDQVALYQAGEIYNPAFLEKLTGFSELRLMDFENTNHSTLQNWADRTTLTSMSWAANSTTASVPIEAQVALANKLNTNIWISIPAEATDDYVTKAITYIHDNLKPGLTVKIEYSNEVWNGAFQQFHYAHDQAVALWGPVYDEPEVYFGYRSAQIAAIAKRIFATDNGTKVEMVLSTQTAAPQRANDVLDGIARANVGSVSDLFSVFAVSNYFGTQFAGANDADKAKILGWATSGQAGVDAAIDELANGGQLSTDYSLRVTLGWLTQSAAFAKANGLSLEVYEGGLDLLGFQYSAAQQPVVESLFKAILADPRVGTLYQQAIDGFSALGGTQWDAYKAIGNNAASGDYGALESVYQTTSVRYAALLAAAQAAAGQPTTPGPVITPVGTTPVAPAIVPDVTTSLASYTLATTSTTLTYTGTGAFSGTGNALDNVLTGGDGGAMLYGMAGNDTLYGGRGNDVLDGGTGDDRMVGGAGNDIYYVDSPGDCVVELPGEGTDEIRTSLASLAISANVENLTYTGQSSFTGTGNELDNTIVGGNFGNTLSGGAGNDVLRGGDGTDHLDGGTGNDTMYGGAGDDIYEVDSAQDVVIEAPGAGNDRINTTVSYTLPDNVETLAGSLPATTTVAGIALPALNLTGLTLTGNAGGNYIIGTDAADHLYGLAGDDILMGGGGDDVIDGGDGNDVVSGGDGNDTLNGGAGNDLVLGGDGDDILTGGGGCDTLTGGAGADTFVICQGDGAASLGNTLTISDFSSADGDRIDLRSYDSNVNKDGINPFIFIGTAAFTKRAGQLRIEKDGSNWILSGDTNGDGVADFSATIGSKTQLTRFDFVL